MTRTGNKNLRQRSSHNQKPISSTGPQGRRKGPRLHDLRHTFAVHRMTMWYEGGIDLGAMLPILATYMGHQSLLSTQKYLHLTIQLIADMADRLDGRFGDVIPGRNDR